MTAPRPIRFDDQIMRDAAAMRAAMPRVVRPDPDALPPQLVEQLERLTDGQRLTLLGGLIDMPGASVYEFQSDDVMDALLPVTEAYRAAYDKVRSVVDYEAGERGQ